MSRSSGASARIFKTLVDPLSRGQTDMVTAAGGGGGEREGGGGCRAWHGGRVHVGAGFHAPANERAYRRVIRRACLAAAAAVLREGGGTSLNAVADAIRVLEWLVTGNAKAQWVKYSVLLASTKESVNRSTASGSESSSIQFDPSVEETGIVVQDLFLQQNRTNFETNEPLSDQQPGK